MTTTELMIDALENALDTLEHWQVKVDFDYDDLATITRIKAALAAANEAKEV